jgi:hypothetical protein
MVSMRSVRAQGLEVLLFPGHVLMSGGFVFQFSERGFDAVDGLRQAFGVGRRARRRGGR